MRAHHYSLNMLFVLQLCMFIFGLGLLCFDMIGLNTGLWNYKKGWVLALVSCTGFSSDWQCPASVGFPDSTQYGSTISKLLGYEWDSLRRVGLESSTPCNLKKTWKYTKHKQHPHQFDNKCAANTQNVTRQTDTCSTGRHRHTHLVQLTRCCTVIKQSGEIDAQTEKTHCLVCFLSLVVSRAYRQSRETEVQAVNSCFYYAPFLIKFEWIWDYSNNNNYYYDFEIINYWFWHSHKMLFFITQDSCDKLKEWMWSKTHNT